MALCVPCHCRVTLHACPMNMHGYFFRRKKKLEKNSQACPMNMLGNQNHVVFFGWVKKNVHACSSYMCGIFFQGFFLKAKKKTTHVSRHTWNFFIKFVKLVNHHTSPRTYLVFFQLTKSKVTYNFGQDDILRIGPQNKVALPETKS